jgi:hypothetical protein
MLGSDFMYGGIAIVVAFVAFGAMYDRLVRWSMRRHVGNRPHLSLSQLYVQYYPQANFTIDELQPVWNAVATILRVDASLLRPTDRFDVELRGLHPSDTDSERSDLWLFIRLACSQNDQEWNPETILTIGDAVQLLCQCQRVHALPLVDRVR